MTGITGIRVCITLSYRSSARKWVGGKAVDGKVVGGKERISEGICRRSSDVVRCGGRVETDLESTLSDPSLLAAGVDSENYIPPVLTDMALRRQPCEYEAIALALNDP